ncbi:hypothetical protein GCM10010885_02820 [Alicyclobacillus cellulosilyticus]|uniref:Uncharacterized protein n=2 Tax=Alicyclobacillus cellulosilyticus TaxID=1003997 RepID=A0A917NEY2_9BACL|nr:hypothetical protein GCM10010885_02820 [Alicyclobacillus cellulosilyticus]
MVSDANGDLFILDDSGKVFEVSPSGQVLHAWSLNAQAITVTADGRTLYASQVSGNDSSDFSSNETDIAIVDTTSGNVTNTITDQDLGLVKQMQVSSNSNTLYAVNDQGNFLVIDLTSGDILWEVSGKGLNSDHPFSTTDGVTLYVPCTYEKGVYAINTMLETGQFLVTDDISDVYGVIESPDGSKVYAVGMGTDFNIVELDTTTGSQTRVFTDPNLLSFGDVSIAENGDTLFVSGEDQRDWVPRIDVIDGTSGKILATIKNNKFNRIRSMLWSPTNSALDVLTDNGLFIYHATPSAGGNGTAKSGASSGNSYQQSSGENHLITLTLQPGWNLVDSYVANSLTGVVTYFWSGTSYISSSTNPVNAEWVYVKSARSITLPPPSDLSYSLTANAKVWTMIGNPFNEPVSVVLQSGDAAFTYDPMTKTYVPAQGGTLNLQPGQGAWLYSAAGGTYEVSIAPPPPPPSN